MRKLSHFSLLTSHFSLPLGALLTALAPAPIGLWGFAWVGLVPLWFQIPKNRSPFRQGLLWGTIYHGISLFWITGLHPLTWMGIPYWNSVTIVTVIWIFITLWGAIGVGAWAWAVAWMANRSFPSWTRILAATALWCVVETVRSYSILDWTNLAYTQSPGNLAILHLGQISGNALISAAIVAFNFTIAEALRSKPRWKSFGPAIGILLISHVLGLILWLQPIDLTSDAKPISIGIIQGNIPTRIKLSANGVRQGLRNYIAGYETLSKQGAQLILMPEGSMPFSWGSDPQNPLAQTIQDLKTPIALGSFGTRGTRTTQSFLMLDDRARVTSQYDKIKVVPLGEALPFEDILGKFITRLSPLKSFLLAGADDQTFMTPFGQAAIGICYESAFPEIFRRQVQTGSEFMITASNLDPYSRVLMAQHEAHDLMRAVENSRYMARVTNTGYSGIITPHGEIKFRSSYQRTETHLGEIFRIKSTTLYTKFGNWITPGLMIASAIALLKFQKP